MYTLTNNGVVVATQDNPIEYVPEQYAWATDSSLVCDTNKEMVVVYTPPVPTAVTMRQARLALLAAGKLAAVTAAINALPSPQKDAAQIEWEYSQEVQRHNGFVAQLGPVLGLDAAALDALFVAAAGL